VTGPKFFFDRAWVQANPADLARGSIHEGITRASALPRTSSRICFSAGLTSIVAFGGLVCVSYLTNTGQANSLGLALAGCLFAISIAISVLQTVIAHGNE
jgi:hypothetical protein